MRRLKIAFVLILSVLLCSCATTMRLKDEPEGTGNIIIFAGTRMNFSSGWAFAHLGIVDWPFSLIADAVTLPYTIPKPIYNVAVDRSSEVKPNNAERAK
jgi:uncharacterized protein YceK